MKVGPKILYVRNRIPVRDSDSVQCSVVTTWSPVTGGFRVQMLVLCMIHVHLHMCYLLPNHAHAVNRFGNMSRFSVSCSDVSFVYDSRSPAYVVPFTKPVDCMCMVW